MDNAAQANPRLAFRMKKELKQHIEEAASLLGLSVTEFVVSALSDRAAEVMERHHHIDLSNRDRDRFLAALDRPGRPIPALVATLKKRQQQPSE